MGRRRPQAIAQVRAQPPTAVPSLTLFGKRRRLALQPMGTNLPGWRASPSYIDAAHLFHALVEDCVRTGKDTRICKLLFHLFVLNQAWLADTLTAAAGKAPKPAGPWNPWALGSPSGPLLYPDPKIKIHLTSW